jgi:hypothetical protein
LFLSKTKSRWTDNYGGSPTDLAGNNMERFDCARDRRYLVGLAIAYGLALVPKLPRCRVGSPPLTQLCGSAVSATMRETGGRRRFARRWFARGASADFSTDFIAHHSR